MRLVSNILAAAVLGLAPLACVHHARSGELAPVNGPATLKVENQGFSDMDIYALSSGGARVRLGTATGNATTRFTIPSYMLGGAQELRFRAEPIGGTRAPVSDRIFVSPGDSVTLIIPPAASP